MKPMSELDRVKDQLVYLRFWLGIMVVTEITLVGWLISTSINVNPRRPLKRHHAQLP